MREISNLFNREQEQKKAFRGWAVLVRDPQINQATYFFSTNRIAAEIYIINSFIEQLKQGKPIQTKKASPDRLTLTDTWKDYKVILEEVYTNIPKNNLFLLGHWNKNNEGNRATEFVYSSVDEPFTTVSLIEPEKLRDAIHTEHNVQKLQSERAYLGLARCNTCHEYKGFFVQEWRNGFSTHKVSCICEGVPCPKCKTNKVRKPISDYWDETEHHSWHVPYFGLRPCKDCERGR